MCQIVNIYFNYNIKDKDMNLNISRMSTHIQSNIKETINNFHRLFNHSGID